MLKKHLFLFALTYSLIKLKIELDIEKGINT